MNRRAVVIPAIGLAAVLAGWALWGVAARMYFNERATLSQRIGTTRATLVQYNKTQGQNKQLQAELQAFIDRTLGGDRETVDHRLRSRLNRIVEHVGLQNASVGTGASPREKESPARSEFRGASEAQRALRDEIDFYEVDGSIRGSGSFEQVLQLIASIEAEPWLKRFDQISFDPTDNGARFDLDLRLTTLFLPRLTPRSAASPAVVSSGSKDRYAAFLLTNPFRVPPTPPAPPVKGPAAPLAPAFAYDQWTLTGIAQSAAGREVWLLNRQTNQRVTLAVGDRLHDAVLLGVQSESAEFLFGNERFRVAVGCNLNDRSAVSQ